MNRDADSPALLALARQGDADAFCELCRLHEARVLRQAIALCGQVESAEDLAQETFVAAWKSIRRYNGKCRFFTWLCSILIHLHKTRLRAREPWNHWPTARQDGAVAGKVLAHAADESAHPDQAMVLSERSALLRRCLETLPKKHREVIFLRFYVDQSLEGIAAALHCSLGTVKSRLFHALEKLRKMKSLTEHLSEKEKSL